MNRILRSTLVLALLMVGGGCAADVERSPQPLEMAELNGSVGALSDFSGEAWRQSAYAWDQATSLDFRFRDDQFAMLAVTINGGDLGEGALAPGQTVTVHNRYGCGSWDEPPPDEPQRFEDGDILVDVIGCTGHADDTWDWDCPADDVTLVIEEGPNPDTVRVTTTATFNHDGLLQTATVTSDIDLLEARAAGRDGGDIMPLPGIVDVPDQP